MKISAVFGAVVRVAFALLAQTQGGKKGIKYLRPTLENGEDIFNAMKWSQF